MDVTCLHVKGNIIISLSGAPVHEAKGRRKAAKGAKHPSLRMEGAELLRLRQRNEDMDVTCLHVKGNSKEKYKLKGK